MLSCLREVAEAEGAYRKTLAEILRQIPLSEPAGLGVFELVAQQVALLDATQTKRGSLYHLLETARDFGWPPPSP